MKPNEKLLITASVAEIIHALVEAFDESLRKHLSVLHQPKEDAFLSRDEARKLLNISLVTLHTWTQHGKLSAHKIAGSSKVYYSERDVRNLIVSSRKPLCHES